MSASAVPLDRQILESLSLARRFSLPDAYRKSSKVFICGMGGSAIGANIVRAVAHRRMHLPFAVYRTSEVPSWLDPQTLAIFSSYSGNTVEVLHAFRRALKSKARMVILTSGGGLARLAGQKKIPCLLIPPGLPPRCAVGYLTFSLLSLFSKLRWLTLAKEETKEVLSVIQSVSGRGVKKIARGMKERSIHLYGVAGMTEAVALRWRSQLAENAKTLASHHLLPEAFHNEIEGWKFPRFAIRKSLAIFFEDKDDPKDIVAKRDFFKALIRRRGGRVLTLPTRGKSHLARIFYLIALGDKVSVELAQLYGEDPIAIPMIERIKKIK